MNVILILLDSLNKDYLSCYGNKWIKTPNIQALADKSLVFESHFVGSLPCIPARRDMLTGRCEFMFRGWGHIEPFDEVLAKKLKTMGIETGIITDHYHYWNANEGYGYTQEYNYCEYIRGTEADNHGFRANKDELCHSIDRYRFPFESMLLKRNLDQITKEEDYTTPQIINKACRYIDNNYQNRNFFLHLELFNPHEPFIAPKRYRNMYTKFDEKFTIWPPYQSEECATNFKNNHLEGEPEYIAKQYASCVSYVDDYLGKLFKKLDQYNLWEDTVVILTSDHGHELFEKGKYGKSYPYYLTVSNIPLLIYYPGKKPQRITGFTQTSDIYQTIVNVFKKDQDTYLNSKDIISMVDGKTSFRDYASFAWFGRGVGYVDKDYFYVSGCDNSKPLFWYSAHPKTGSVGVELSKVDFSHATSGKYIKDVDLPVWKIPCKAREDIIQKEHLYARNDKQQLHDLDDEATKKIYRKKLLKALEEMDAPKENIERLNLNK